MIWLTSRNIKDIQISISSEGAVSIDGIGIEEEDILVYIRCNYKPKAVFLPEDLERWAEDNDYIPDPKSML